MQFIFSQLYTCIDYLPKLKHIASFQRIFFPQVTYDHSYSLISFILNGTSSSFGSCIWNECISNALDFTVIWSSFRMLANAIHV